MLRTAWRAAKARVGNLLASGRPPAPRPGLREPTSQASMAMTPAGGSADSTPLVTTSILEFTSSGELEPSNTEEVIRRWAFRCSNTNLQPEHRPFEPRDSQLRLQPVTQARDIRSELLYQIDAAATVLNQGDAPEQPKPLRAPPTAVGRPSTSETPVPEQWLLDFQPEQPSLTARPVAVVEAPLPPPLDTTHQDNGPGFAAANALGRTTEGKQWLSNAKPDPIPSEGLRRPPRLDESPDLESARPGRSSRSRRAAEVPPASLVDLLAESAEAWQLLARSATMPSAEPTLAASAALPAAVVDRPPPPADPLPASPAVPPIAVSRPFWDPNSDLLEYMPPSLDSVNPIEKNPAVEAIVDDGSSPFDPLAFDAVDDSSFDWLDSLVSSFGTPSSLAPSLTATGSPSFTSPAVPVSDRPVDVESALAALADEPPAFYDNFDVTDLLDACHDRRDYKTATRRLRLHVLRQKRELLQGKTKAEQPIVDHLDKVGHADYYAYQIAQKDLYPTYEEQYAHAIAFWKGFTRTDIRPSYEDFPAFEAANIAPKRFMRHKALQLAARKGWLSPDHKDVRRSRGYRVWANRFAWTERVKQAVERGYLASVDQRLNSEVHHFISLALHHYDLLVDEERLPHASLKNLAIDHEVQLEVLKPMAQISRLLRVTGRYSSTRKFEDAVKRLTTRVMSDNIQMPLDSKWTAEDITREILEPQFRTWQRSLGDSLPMDRLHLTLDPVDDEMTEMTFASVRQEMISFAIVAVANRLELPRQATPLYVIQGSEETRHNICRLEAEPDTGHYRLRAIADRREEYEHVGGPSDLRCDSVLAPLSSFNVPSGEDIYQPELQDALDLGPVNPKMSWDDLGNDNGPKTRIEARFGKFTFSSNPGFGFGVGQVHDLAAELSSKRTFTPLTGTAVDRLKRDWIAGKRQLEYNVFHRIQYVSSSCLSMPTSKKALVFEWQQNPCRRRWSGLRSTRRKGGRRPRQSVSWDTQTMWARDLDLRTANILFPKRNFDAIISKIKLRKIHPRVIPRRLRRVFRLDPERWLDPKNPKKVQERTRASTPRALRHGKSLYVLDKNEEVERSVYLVEDDVGPNGERLAVPSGLAGRKVVVERITCHLTGVESETIILEADDPREKGSHPDAYLPEDMLKDVNHMLCMEDQSW